MNELPADYHVHTALCRHAEGHPIDYARKAKALNLRALGFSDHFPARYLPNSLPLDGYTMRPDEIPLYVSMVEEARRETQGLEIKLGFEVDYYAGAVQAVQDLLKGVRVDYLYMSVHVLGDWCIDDEGMMDRYANCDMDSLVNTYMDTLTEGVSTGLFDILSHADLFKKFGFGGSPPLSKIQRLADAVKESGMAVEINTGGLRKPCREAYPSVAFLQAFAERHIPLVFGSDAHRPEEVGWEFAHLLPLVRSLGFRQWADYTGRSLCLHPL